MSTSTSSDDMQSPSPDEPAPRLTFNDHIRMVISQPVAASFMAGGIAGAVSRTVVSPLERLKILFQVQSRGRNAYKMSVPKALAKIWREEGMKGMMAGNGTNCIRIVPYSAVQFGSYNFYKPYFEDRPGAPLGSAKRLVCGGLAGITSVTFTYPLDIVRTRLSIQSASFHELGRKSGEKLPGMWQLLVIMYKTEGGWKALYRGILPTIAGVAPYVGLNFMIYESVRAYFTPQGQKDPGPAGKLCAGAISGGLAQTCTYPFDVLRRRFQVNTMSGMGYEYSTINGAIRQIFMEEGFKGLYKGLTPNLLKVAPSMAASWYTFETFRDWFIASGEAP